MLKMQRLNSLKSFIILLLLCSILFSQESANLNGKEISKLIYPESSEEFNPIFHFPPINQDTTYVCWSFATSSFLESEMQRLGKDPVKLSVMYPVYYGFIEKAKHFIHTKGKSRFSAGDLFGTVLNIIQKYGIVPENVYTGNPTGNNSYNHTKLYDELYNYMDQVKKDSIWTENIVIPKIKEILNKHLGQPPLRFSYNSVIYSPLKFESEILNLPWQDYIQITSFKNADFYQYTSLAVPDNWLPDSNYFNIPLDEFYNTIKHATKNNYSLAIDGDIGEPGRIGEEDICIIPNYDIPAEFISQDAREYRFEKGLTTDDHLMHIIGYQIFKNGDWFLVKDSWRDAFKGKHKGYFFFSEEYVKLKVLAFIVHKDALPAAIKNKI